MLFPAALVCSLLAAGAAARALGTTGLPDEPPPWGAALLAKVGRLEGTISSLQTTIDDHSARIRELEAGPSQPGGDSTTTATGRRLQAPQNPSKVVHIHRTSVVIPEGPGWRTSGNYNGGHRILQGSASCPTFSHRVTAVSTECCNEPTEDCSSGAPAVCNAGCAAVFLPFWADCSSLLPHAAQYQGTVALCQASAHADAGGGGASSSTVHEFRLVCSDGSTNCVPPCDESLHGDLLLLALNGEDSKYSCEVHHGNFSWVGPSGDGGYIGTDLRSWLSAVLSGAAGLFHVLASVAAAGVGVDVTIQPGMKVYVMGAPTVWGVGGFTVHQGGILSLARITLAQTAHIAVSAGGSLALADLALRTTQLAFASGRGGGLS
eukprot:COSAG01_NODE_7599_length_3123_cov_203.193867_2_plen_376_part_01